MVRESDSWPEIRLAMQLVSVLFCRHLFHASMSNVLNLRECSFPQALTRCLFSGVVVHSVCLISSRREQLVAKMLRKSNRNVGWRFVSTYGIASVAHMFVQSRMPSRVYGLGAFLAVNKISTLIAPQRHSVVDLDMRSAPVIDDRMDVLMRIRYHVLHSQLNWKFESWFQQKLRYLWSVSALAPIYNFAHSTPTERLFLTILNNTDELLCFTKYQPLYHYIAHHIPVTDVIAIVCMYSGVVFVNPQTKQKHILDDIDTALGHYEDILAMI